MATSVNIDLLFKPINILVKKDLVIIEKNRYKKSLQKKAFFMCHIFGLLFFSLRDIGK